MPEFLKQRPARQAKGEIEMSKRIKTKFPGIYKYETAKGPRYQVRFGYFTNGIKKEFSRSGISGLAEAKSIYNDQQHKLENGQLSRPEVAFTVAQYYAQLREFKLASGVWNKNTLSVNDDRFKKFKEHFGHLKLSELTRLDYQRWINHQYKVNGYSQSTMEGFHSHFMMILNDAVEEDYLDKNRLLKVNLVREGYEPKEKIVHMEDYYTFLETAERILPGDRFTMIYLGTFGARRGEVYGIRLNAIHFFEHDGKEFAQIDLHTSISRNYPEGNKPKTKKGKRMVVVNAKAAQLLHAQIERCKRIKKTFNTILNQNDFIFISPETGKPYYLEVMNEAMRKVEVACEIKMHPHMLRHMFATAADIADVNGDDLRDFMGHETEEMTKHYTHQTQESALKIMQKTDTILHRKV